jgi:heme-degrading monooxygenase HmoA
MIARLWRGRAGSAENGDAYQRHVMGQVFPALRKVSGHRGGQVLRRHDEFLVITFWDSMDAIRRFAGEDSERAVVEPEARAVLAEFDDFVRHYEVQE